jgi:class 3 adenylate cyclase/predicted ATPase
MHCPACASEVPDGTRFCGACGTELGVRCGRCGTPAAVSDQSFCGRCGAPLTAVAAPVLERRLVSVLFCDLVSFTSFSDDRDPEDVRELLGHYFSVARRVVDRYGGTIEKFIGDAVMAVWGAPVAREDDAERSVRAALELTTGVSALASRLATPELRIRVGVLTGEAAVEVGRVHEGMVVGDAVNTASRIQGLAVPGAVLVDDMTRLASERSIAFEAAGTHAVKGKSLPVRTWRALRVLSRVGRGRAAGVETPFVGRDGPVAQVADALRRLAANEPGPHLLSITGEAGVGKSRLVWELEKQAEEASAQLTWCRGRAISLGGGAAFSAVAEMVRAFALRIPDDSAEAQRVQLGVVLTELFGADRLERDRVEQALHRLLELDDGRRLIEPGELFSAWRAWFGALAARRPLVMVLEELQEADQALLDFVAHLLEWSRFPLLILAVSRPASQVDAIAALEDRVELGPLASADMDALVTGAIRDAPAPLVAVLRADSGGIPLYTVETLRALADRGVLAIDSGRYVVCGEVGDVTVAPTIQALIASRLDGLGRLERQILTGGAIIGERFSAAAASATAGIDPVDGSALLTMLVTKAFLAVDNDRPLAHRGGYAFLQGAVRRVTLSRLSRRERKRFHLAAADHLAFIDAEPERAAALAEHLLAAVQANPRGDDVRDIESRARTALHAAAERAAAVGALADALALFDRVIALTADEHECAALLERAGFVASHSNEADAAAKRYSAAGELHARAGRRRDALAARAHELRSLQYVRSADELLPALRKVDAALAGHEDRSSALAAATLAYTLYQLGESEEALAVASRGASIAEKCGATRELLHALGQQGSALAELQRPDEAIAVYSRALAIAQSHQPRLAALLQDNIAISLASVGRYRDAANTAREAIKAAERGAERVAEQWGRLVLGRALCSLGAWDDAVAEIEAVAPAVAPIQLGMAFAPLVVIALARGERERARELVAEHERRATAEGDSLFDSDFRSVRRTVLAAGTPELAAIIPGATAAEFAEWTGWLAPVVDALVSSPTIAPLKSALAALRTPEAMKQTPPVQAQAERLAGHLAARVGDLGEAMQALTRAERLAASCEAKFEAAAVALERSELSRTDPENLLPRARATFARLGAVPWDARAERALSRL